MSFNHSNEVATVVRTFIDEELVKIKQPSFDANVDLLKEGVIDSLSLMRLIAFLEEQFHLQIEDEEIVPENFRTLSAIVDFVSQHQAANNSLAS